MPFSRGVFKTVIVSFYFRRILFTPSSADLARVFYLWFTDVMKFGIDWNLKKFVNWFFV